MLKMYLDRSNEGRMIARLDKVEEKMTEETKELGVTVE